MTWLLALLLAVPAAAQTTIAKFCGVNNAVDPAAIEECEAQDALNVESNRTGTGIKKRDGYEPALTVSTAGTQILSLVDFKVQTGNECLLAIDDKGTVFRSLNSAAAVAISTFAAGDRLFCSISDGLAYCYTSGNGLPFTYDCTTWSNITLSTAGYPNGKFNVIIQDRQLVAGTTDFLNRLYVSQSGALHNFVVGINAVSAFTEDIGRNGDRITGLAFLNGRVIVFKEYSIGGFNITDQFNSVYYDIAHNVGIADPTAWAIAEGLLYFKASDNHIYVMDGSPGSVRRISKKIEKTIAAVLNGKARYVILTDKTDFDGGSYIGQGTRAAMDGTTIPGSVIPSSISFLDTSTSDWNAGTVATEIDSTTYIGSLTLSLTTASTYSWDTFEDGDITAAPVWTPADGTWLVVSTGGSNVAYLSASGGVVRYMTTPSTATYGRWSWKKGMQGNITINSGGTWAEYRFISDGTDFFALTLFGNSLQNSFTVRLRKYKNGSYTTIGSDSLNYAIAPGSPGTLDILRTTTGYFEVRDASSLLISGTDNAVITGTKLEIGLTGTDAGQPYDWADNIQVPKFNASGLFTSRTFDTGFSTPTGGTFSVSSSVPVGTGLTFQVRSASSPSGTYTSWTTLANAGQILETNRYYQYQSSFTTSTSTRAPMVLDVSLIAATTGQYITPCMQPGAGISAWGTMEMAGVFSNGGSFTIQNSTGTSCTDPGLGGTWTNASTGTTISIATAAAYKARVTFNVTSATSTAAMDSLTLNWTEGNVAPPAYAVYWNSDLYFALSTGTTKNNRLLRYDPGDESFHVFDIGANSPISYNNNFLFGSTSNGKIYRYSNINPASAPTSDDGAAINAYWRSKSFSGGAPFQEKQVNAVSLLARKQAGGTLTGRWSINGGNTATGSYSVTMSTGHAVVNHNYRLPLGQRGIWWDYQVGNNSTLPFEVLGVRFDYDVLPWRVLP